MPGVADVQTNLIAAAIGFLTGFIIAIPPGPINFAIFEKSVHNHRASAIRLILGAVCGDMGYLVLVLLYQVSASLLFWIKVIFSVGGAAFLIVLGTYYIFFKKTPVRSPHEPTPEEVLEGHFWTGLVISLSNPFFILAMIAVTDFLYSVKALVPHPLTNLIFILGFGAGVFTWLSELGRFMTKRRARFTDAGSKIRLTCGIAFTCFGFYMLGKFILLLF